MSYDVWIGDKSFNYTFNVSKLFYDHIPDTGKGGGLREIDGLTGKAVVEILAPAFDAINRTRTKVWRADVVGDPEFCARYDAPNGWGSAIGAICFLAEILAACALNPRRRLRVGI